MNTRKNKMIDKGRIFKGLDSRESILKLPLDFWVLIFTTIVSFFFIIWLFGVSQSKDDEKEHLSLQFISIVTSNIN